jgi:hypothetical protein
MSGTVDQFEGGCLCGMVRFIATGQPKGIYWCHCQSCRNHTGAPASVFAAFDRKAYSVRALGEVCMLQFYRRLGRYSDEVHACK